MIVIVIIGYFRSQFFRDSIPKGQFTMSKTASITIDVGLNNGPLIFQTFKWFSHFS